MTEEILTLKEALKVGRMSRNRFFDLIKVDQALKDIFRAYSARAYRVSKSAWLAYLDTLTLSKKKGKPETIKVYEVEHNGQKIKVIGKQTVEALQADGAKLISAREFYG